VPLPESFVTPRLRAVRLTHEHLGEIRRMHLDPVVMASLGGVRTEAQTVAYHERNLRHWDQYGFGVWILHERDGSEIIGRTLLRHLAVDGVDEVEVGYAFYAPYWARGLATEATGVCLAMGRERLGLPSIVAITRPSNLASQRVLVKSGLIYERDMAHEGSVHALFRTAFTA